MSSMSETERNTVTPGALAYLCHTGTWDIAPADPTFSGAAEAHFSVVTDGPYSSYALAERAADIRAEQERRLASVDGAFEVSGIGGTGSAHDNPHGNAVEWTRPMTYRSGAEKFGDREGWQQIRLVTVDVLP